VIDDGKGGKKIIAQMAAIDKAFKVAVAEVERISEINLG
jgi:DNA sulfur modification protein DndB